MSPILYRHLLHCMRELLTVIVTTFAPSDVDGGAENRCAKFFVESAVQRPDVHIY
jgi:hypothetical protein